MKRKFISIFIALVLVLTLGLVTAVPVAAADPSTFDVTGGTYTTTPTGESPFETGTISANLAGTWGAPAVIGEFTATGEGGLYGVPTPPTGPPWYGTTATISVSGTLAATEITFSGTAVRTVGDPITPDAVTDIEGTITIGSDGAFVANLTGTVASYTVYLDITGDMVGTIDLVVNDESPWEDGAFTFENISPGGDPMEFDFKLHNVGGGEGVLTFSMSVSENDMDGAPAPNMSADEFASLIYVEAVSYRFKWPADPDTWPDGYVGGVHDDIDKWLGMDLNGDGKVSLYEICEVGTIPYDAAGDPLQATAEITYFIIFQLGDSLEGEEGFAAGGAILTGVEDNRFQGDGISVTITANLGSDEEESSGNVFQAGTTWPPAPVTIGENGYYTIQAAVNAANPAGGDTITVAAGTYNENIVINKSLTLEGANAGVKATEERGPESIIDAQLADYGVFIIEATTTATLDGFTVTNYETCGILAGAFSPPEDDPFVVHILNNIVKPPTIDPPHNNNIQMGDGTTGTIIGNEVSGALLVDPDWSGSGILVAGSSDVLVSNNYVHDCEGGIQIVGYLEYRDAPAVNNIVEYNLVEGNEWGISIQTNSIGTIVKYNDVLNNNTSGIGSIGNISWEPTIPSGTQIHYNNIVGNGTYGVKSSVWDETLGGAEEVDAENNWWGSAVESEVQAMVSANVDYSPWWGANYVGDDHSSAWTWYTNDSIQDAIDAAVDDDTVIVAAGTYDEQVEIGKNLTLQGAGDTTIIQPSTTTASTLTVKSTPWYGGGEKDMAAIVWVDTSGGTVTVKDLKIDGINITETDKPADIGGDEWVTGLAYLETSGTVDAVTVEDVYISDGVYRTCGIWTSAITYTSTVEVKHSTVIKNNRAGIYGLGAKLTVDFNHNIMTGPGTLANQVPNAIFLMEGCIFSCTYNTISQYHYGGTTYRSSGIATFYAGSGLIFGHNTIFDVDNAFALSTYTSDITVEYNEIYNCHTGVRIEAGAANGIIQYNDIHDNDFAIRCGPEMGDGNVAHYNNFVNNSGSAWINVEGGSEYTYEGAVCNLHETYTFDATNNWWGDETGPYHATLNPGVIVNGVVVKMGNAVSDDVLFSPWLYKTQEAIVPTKEPAYAQSIVLDNYGEYGWNTFSTPIYLDGTADTWAKLITLTDLDYSIAYRFDSANQWWEELITTDEYLINPGEGFFIKMNTAGSLPILCSTADNLTPPSRALTVAWNLIGLANVDDMEASVALFSLAGEGQVVSPSGNESPGAVLTGHTVYVGEAYWVYMLGERTLAGFTMTPVDWVP